MYDVSLNLNARRITYCLILNRLMSILFGKSGTFSRRRGYLEYDQSRLLVPVFDSS